MTRKKPKAKRIETEVEAGTAKKKPATPRRRRKSKIALIQSLIKKTEKKLSETDVKATIGDLIRLIQMEDELEERQPKEVRVRWIDPPRDSNSSA